MWLRTRAAPPRNLPPPPQSQLTLRSRTQLQTPARTGCRGRGADGPHAHPQAKVAHYRGRPWTLRRLALRTLLSRPAQRSHPQFTRHCNPRCSRRTSRAQPRAAVAPAPKHTLSEHTCRILPPVQSSRGVFQSRSVVPRRPFSAYLSNLADRRVQLQASGPQAASRSQSLPVGVLLVECNRLFASAPRPLAAMISSVTPKS